MNKNTTFLPSLRAHETDPMVYKVFVKFLLMICCALWNGFLRFHNNSDDNNNKQNCRDFVGNPVESLAMAIGVIHKIPAPA